LKLIGETSEEQTKLRIYGIWRRLSTFSFKVAATIVALIITAFILFYIIIDKPPEQTVPMHKRVTSTGKASIPAISPDGGFMAYFSEEGGKNNLMVRELLDGEPIKISSGIVAEDQPHLNWLRWSPDGSQLLFSCDYANDTSSGGTFIIPKFGGELRRILNLGQACWSPDGSQIACKVTNYKRITILNTALGDTSSMIPLIGSFLWVYDVDWSPLGNRLLFLTKSEQKFTIWSIHIDGTEQEKLVEENGWLCSPRWTSDGKAIYYFHDKGETKDLMKIKISSTTGKPEGIPRAVQTGLRTGEMFSLSADNRQLLNTRESQYSNLWLINLGNNGETKILERKQLTSGTSEIHSPNISPDGKSIVFSKGNIFVMPIDGGEMKQLTFLNSENFTPVWSPDGKEIAFGSTAFDKKQVSKVPADGGRVYPFNDTELSDTYILAWAPGRDILYHRLGNRNFHMLNAVTEEEISLVTNDSVGFMFNARTSPDGKRIAAYWYRGGNDMRIWIISLEDSSQIPIYNGYAFPLVWSTDGKWIYACKSDEKPLEIIKIAVGDEQVNNFITLPFDNILYREDGISLTPDGRRIVCAVMEKQSDIWLMENFDPEFR
jgi:Tol biopolymer transport system component